MELSSTTPEDDPELVAVFDLAGPAENFYKAALNVPGLEFLFDVEDDDVDPDDDFFFADEDGGAADKSVPQHLYMVMSNASALGELIRLFELWRADNAIKLDWGLNSLKDVFALLRNIRRWEPEDRVRETGLLEQWRDDASDAGSQSMRAEIELWYRSDVGRRDAARLAVERALAISNGRIITSSVIEDIRYHGLLIEVPRSAVESVLANGAAAIQVLTVEDVMFAMAVPQHGFAVPDTITEVAALADSDTPSGLPQVALLDGLPLGNHIALAGRLIIDDPEDVASRYTAVQRRHGTAMASLIVHGPLDARGEPLKRPVYVLPILEPHPFFTDREVFSEEALFIDVLHRALRRVLDQGEETAGTTEDIRIVNLSVGDAAKVFIRRVSPQARLVDWFSHRYNVLIVVSAGNHSGADIALDVPSAAPGNADDLHAEVLRLLQSTERRRRLMAPAEAINAITVGAAHSDAGVTRVLPDHLTDPLPEGMPATYSSMGFGYRRAVKPEVLLPGGRLVYRKPVPDGERATVHLEPEDDVEVAGLSVAAPGLAGELNGLALTCGTSNAAALATRSLARIWEAFETPGAIEGDLPESDLHPAIAKALLVHAAAWGPLKAQFVDGLGLGGNGVRHSVTKVLGYGVVTDDRVASATARRVVLLGGSTIKTGQRHTYRYPLPPSLRASAEWRRLTVTLAWISAVNPRTQKYRMARLRFGDVHDALALGSLEADRRAAVRGTVQHEVLEGRRATVFQDGDSIAIDVDCRVDVGSTTTQTRYGIVASLEVGVSVQADIHNEVRQQLRARAEVPVRERIRS
jgi:Subtilase family